MEHVARTKQDLNASNMEQNLLNGSAAIAVAQPAFSALGQHICAQLAMKHGS